MKTLLAFIFIFLSGTVWADSELVGKWKTIDDETGRPKSVVEIYQDDGVFNGRVIEVIESKKPNPICESCPGDKKDQPVQGLEIIWGLKEKEKGQEWGGGEILDPAKGKVYKCRLRLKENGERLEVRGFIGFSLLGRSQIWHRVK